jgi:hypothetical protein
MATNGGATATGSNTGAPTEPSSSSRGRGDKTRGRGRGRGGRGRGGRGDGLRGDAARGGGAGRGRGRGNPTADDAIETTAPVPGEPSATGPKVPNFKSQGGEPPADGEDEEAEVCFICANPATHHSVAPCNHATCHICALRLRALYKNKECPHCRVSCLTVVSSLLPWAWLTYPSSDSCAICNLYR